jgi:hypothetical protein
MAGYSSRTLIINALSWSAEYGNYMIPVAACNQSAGAGKDFPNIRAELGMGFCCFERISAIFRSRQ